MSRRLALILYIVVVILAVASAVFIAVTPIDPKPPQDLPPNVPATVVPGDVTVAEPAFTATGGNH